MSKTVKILALVAFSAFAGAAYASPSETTSTFENLDHHPSLRTIVRNWDDYGFQAPTKPAQMRVNGRNGVSISGSDYASALSTLRAGQIIEGRSAARASGRSGDPR